MARIASALALAAALLAPAGAAAMSPGYCARYERQIEHFEGMVERARELGNEMWEERTQQHVDLLRARAAANCPNVDEDAGEAATRAMLELLRLGARAALTYFTMGAF